MLGLVTLFLWTEPNQEQGEDDSRHDGWTNPELVPLRHGFTEQSLIHGRRKVDREHLGELFPEPKWFGAPRTFDGFDESSVLGDRFGHFWKCH